MAVDARQSALTGTFEQVDAQDGRQSPSLKIGADRTQQQIQLLGSFHGLQEVQKAEWQQTTPCFAQAFAEIWNRDDEGYRRGMIVDDHLDKFGFQEW